MVYFGGFFAKQGYFAGFSLCIINFSVRIIEAAMGGFGEGGIRDGKLGKGQIREGGCVE